MICPVQAETFILAPVRLYISCSHLMTEDLRSVLGIEFEAEFNTHMRYWIHEIPLPMLIELPPISLEEEELRIIHDLGRLWNFLPLRYLDDSCIQLRPRELLGQYHEKRRLIERLDALPSQLRDWDEISCLGINQLSIICHDGHEQPAPLPPPSTTRPGEYPPNESRFIRSKRLWLLDDSKSPRAESHLGLYNKRWKVIQAQSATASCPSTPPAIPWPNPSLFHRSQFNPSTEILAWKWATHAFFAEAFGLRPPFDTDEGNEAHFGFVSDHASWETVGRLKGLRRQMKLEKVRWHEDKMKAIFSPAVTTQGWAKAVWSAVIDLREIEVNGAWRPCRTER